MLDFFYNLALATLGAFGAIMATVFVFVTIVFICVEWLKMSKETALEYFLTLLLAASTLVWFLYIFVGLYK